MLKKKILGNLAAKKAALVPVVGGAVAAGTSVVAFATEGSGGGTTTNLPSIAITTEMLTPLVEGVVANVQVILPVGLGLFAIFLGIRIIPGLISRFVRM